MKPTVRSSLGHRSPPYRWVVLLAAISLLPILAAGNLVLAAGLTFEPSLPEPQDTGTPILWTADYDGVGQFLYRFSVQFLDGADTSEHVVQDYSPEQTFLWAPIDPGLYRVHVRVRRASEDTSFTGDTVQYEITNPAELSGQAGVRPSDHPLVAIYDAPPCSDRNDDVAVEVRRPSDPWQRRAVKPCAPRSDTLSIGTSFWVAGLRAETTYLFRHVEITPSGEIPSQPLTLTTGPVTGINVAGCHPSRPWTGASRPTQPVLLISPPPESGTPVPYAVDMTGRLVWYDDGPDREGEVALVTTISDDGTILELVSANGRHDQILREIDPAGHAVRRTTVGRINEQLVAAAAPDTIGAFFHEAIRFPDGNTLAGCSVERMLDGVQGIPEGSPEDVVGNMIVALDEDWQLVWYWDAFEQLDLDRGAVLDEHCGDQTPGCPPLDLAPVARDWTHGNCLVPAWNTGDLLYSLRHQDWIAWIDYAGGTGDGSVLAMIGRDGDLPLAPDPDPDNWFSHQHGIEPIPENGYQFLVFDNGNTRCEGAGSDCHSRGQLMEIGGGGVLLEANHDLGEYSSARGMSQLLDSGDTHFTLGTLGTPSEPLSRSVELDGAGNQTFALECATWAYRTYRITSLEAPR